MSGCRCQVCGLDYVIDLLVPDDVWERIKPPGKGPGAGLLCPGCIGDRMEDAADGEHACYTVRKT